MREPSSPAAIFASSTICAPRLSACARISCACWRASFSMSAVFTAACSRSCLPRSAAARPSAMCFWRASIARDRCGHTNFAVNQMKIAKVAACANKVKLMFMTACAQNERSANDCEQRVAEREQHREADADDERRVDETQQQKHLGLQRRNELGLARAGFQKLAAHDADADTRAGGAEAD